MVLPAGVGAKEFANKFLKDSVTGIVKAGGKAAFNLAARATVGAVAAPIAVGAIGLGAASLLGKAASLTEMPPIGDLPGTGLRNVLNKAPGGWGIKMNYEMARYTHLNPGFALGLGGGLAAGAAYTAATYSRTMPPFTNQRRIQYQEHPYNLGASGDMVLAAHNMR